MAGGRKLKSFSNFSKLISVQANRDFARSVRAIWIYPFIVFVFSNDRRALEPGKQISDLRVLTGSFMGLYYIGSNFL